jgi:2-dehydropantoate 2-reductase
MDRPRYAVVGVGALGGYYGGLLAKSGCDVHFLCHSDGPWIRQHGLRVDSPSGDFVVREVQAHDGPDSIGACDVVIIALKSTMNDVLRHCVPPLMHDRTVLVVLQNGLHVERVAANIAGRDRVLGGCCFLCSNKVGPGHIRHLDYGRVAMGVFRTDEQGREFDLASGSPSLERLPIVVRDFEAAGIPIEVAPSLEEARWRKLMWNIPFNGLSVVLDASTRQLMEQSQGAQLAEDLMREVRDAACHLGQAIEIEFADKLISDTRVMVPYDSSMRLDHQAGRPMEIESIFGNPLRAAQARGLPMLRLEVLYRQLKFIEAKGRRESQSSLSQAGKASAPRFGRWSPGESGR